MEEVSNNLTGYFLEVVNDIFSKNECQELIDRANIKGWHNPQTGGYYMRSIIIDRELANNMFEKLKDLIPKSYMGYDLLYINDHFRFSRYKKGGKFHIHKDGVNYDSSRKNEFDGFSTESVFTINIFLNDEFTGGETDFLMEKYHKSCKKDRKKSNKGKQNTKSKIKEDNFDLRLQVKPKTGRGVMFYAKQYHRGNEVLTSFKYLIRTDVMGIKQ